MRPLGNHFWYQNKHVLRFMVVWHSWMGSTDKQVAGNTKRDRQVSQLLQTLWFISYHPQYVTLIVSALNSIILEHSPNRDNWKCLDPNQSLTMDSVCCPSDGNSLGRVSHTQMTKRRKSFRGGYFGVPGHPHRWNWYPHKDTHSQTSFMSSHWWVVIQEYRVNGKPTENTTDQS
jgi:hypothetical protein